MIQEIEQYLGNYPEEIVLLFIKIRDVVFSIDCISLEEKAPATLQ